MTLLNGQKERSLAMELKLLFIFIIFNMMYSSALCLYFVFSETAEEKFWIANTILWYIVFLHEKGLV